MRYVMHFPLSDGSWARLTRTGDDARGLTYRQAVARLLDLEESWRALGHQRRGYVAFPVG